MLAFAMAVMSLQAQTYVTRPFIADIKSLQVIADKDFMKLPVMDLAGETEIEISFDYISDTQPWLAYSLVHCDADWKKDNLDQMDYVDGFLPVKISDVTPSFNTFIGYYHFSIKFPNEDLKLTASGNYAILIHPEDDEEDVLAVATFSVSEQMAFASGEISQNTDIDFKKAHQQVNMSISWSQNQLPYLDPINDLKVIVSQNRRFDTRRRIIMTSRTEAGKAVYEHNRDLIFEAGNNYRRFEFTDERYASLGVDNIRYQAPYYIVNLITDKPNIKGGYLYDKDQNGRFLIHALKVEDEAVEAEYFKAVFTLEGKGRRLYDDIYLDGDFTYGQVSDEFKMEYDSETDTYHKEVLLKQGAYNYQYLVNGSTQQIEGNYSENENEYIVYIYFHPNGAKYDRLLGVAKISSFE